MPSHQDDKDHFDRAANDKVLWLNRAKDLHLSASILREKWNTVEAGGFDPQGNLTQAFLVFNTIGILAQAAMLQGFTIEVYLKAYCLHQGNILSEDGEYELPGLKRDNHDLVAIAAAVGFPLAMDESEVLARLSLFVTSYGRYPITKRWQQNPLKVDVDGIAKRMSWNDADHEVAERVIERLKAATK
jgi:hypothetical protein